MDSTYDLEKVRADLPILDNWTYLNTGTVGISPTPVVEAELRLIADYEQGGHTGQPAAQAAYETARKKLAKLLSVCPDDLVFNRNATDGINFVAAGFPLTAGDEVITSTEEHPAMHVPWMVRCAQAEATLRYVDVTPDPDNFAKNLSELVNPNTRVVALSHVSCESGTRLPVHVIRDIVGPDCAILIDASQSVGQFNVDIQTFSADFVIGNGHKWLAGPKGTGFAWFNSSSMELIPPVHFASETLDPPWSRSYYQVPDPPSRLDFSSQATRFEFGTRSWHLYGALVDAIDYQAGLGWSNIERHMSQLSSYLKNQLAAVPGVSVVSPGPWNLSSGLVTFTLEGVSGEEVSRRLWQEHNIVQRRVEVPSAVRISCAYYNSIDDIDALIRAVRQIASS